MLKVTVAEVQRQVLKQLGITSSIASGSWGTFTQQNGLPLNLQPLTTGAATFGSGSLSATLTAFERDGVARVLAEPTVTAVSGESAKFTAGGQIPTPQNETCPPPEPPAPARSASSSYALWRHVELHARRSVGGPHPSARRDRGDRNRSAAERHSSRTSMSRASARARTRPPSSFLPAARSFRRASSRCSRSR